MAAETEQVSERGTVSAQRDPMNDPYALGMKRNGAGMPRGFRKQGADDFARPEPDQADDPPTSPTRPEVLESGPPPRQLPSWLRRADLRLAGQSPTEQHLAGQPPAGQRTALRWLLAATALISALVVVIAALAFRLGATSKGSADQPAASTPTPAATATPLPVPNLYRRLVPSVVLITTSKGSLGSGTVVTATGTVLTANHVVSDGGSVSILFADGTKSAATIATSESKTDTATLTPAKLPEIVVPATLGGGVVVGADVVAIGNPLGLRDSTTTGVVSGLARTSKTTAGSVSGLIQFDAAVNPGSSGGPLLDAQGLVVGVVVSIADPGKDEAFAGIGFAVPVGAALGGTDGSGPGSGGQL